MYKGHRLKSSLGQFRCKSSHRVGRVTSHKGLTILRKLNVGAEFMEHETCPANWRTNSLFASAEYHVAVGVRKCDAIPRHFQVPLAIQLQPRRNTRRHQNTRWVAILTGCHVVSTAEMVAFGAVNTTTRGYPAFQKVLQHTWTRDESMHFPLPTQIMTQTERFHEG